MLKRFVVNYVRRHQRPANQALHVVGVPLTFVVSTVLAIRGDIAGAGLAFASGYALQFLGHYLEGNDAGEVILFKRWLGLPYVEFCPGRDSAEV